MKQQKAFEEQIREVIRFVREQFHEPDAFIPLHEPRFVGKEREYVMDAIDSTFVSSVGRYVNRFEEMMCELTGARYAVATVNGTAALHAALIGAGVSQGEEVLTQPLSFIATANAINYCGATPVFIDVDKHTLGMSAEALRAFLEEAAELSGGKCYNRHTGKQIAACVPMHTFGIPCEVDELAKICEEYDIILIEDAAESLGSTYKGKHTGTFGLMGAFSFNGNKIATCGGGGAIVTNDEALAKKLKHLTTTAKKPHPWSYEHDMIGYNYRMPNLNAAMACAQLEKLPEFLEAKRALALRYKDFFEKQNIPFIEEPENCKSNYWLNGILLKDAEQRDQFLKITNEAGVMTRPVWTLLHRMPMFAGAQCGDLSQAEAFEKTIVNLPSSVILKA